MAARRSAMSARAAASKPSRSSSSGAGVCRQCARTAARSSASGTCPGPGVRMHGAASARCACRPAAASRSAASRARRWRAMAGPRSTPCVPCRKAVKGVLPARGLRSSLPCCGAARSIQRPVFTRRASIAAKSDPGPVSNRSLRTAASAHRWGWAACVSPAILAAAQAIARPGRQSRAPARASIAAGSAPPARPSEVSGKADAAFSNSAKSCRSADSTGTATTACSTSCPMGVAASAAAVRHAARLAATARAVPSASAPADECSGVERSGPSDSREGRAVPYSDPSSLPSRDAAGVP